MVNRFFKVFIIVLFSGSAFARLSIPNNLNKRDREVATEVLGPSSSMKLLGNPYPLGGYSGVEFSFVSEYLSTGEVSRLGNKSSQQAETNYTLFKVGKGIYNNLDFYLQFAFVNNDENLSNFGGQIRWGFLEAEYIPAYLSLLLSANSVNYQNKITTNNYGADIVAGVNVQDVTVFLGGGIVKSQGLFQGGAAGVTDDQNTHKENAFTNHYLAGVNVQFSEVFLALQIDRYVQSTYSGKIGFRF